MTKVNACAGGDLRSTHLCLRSSFASSSWSRRWAHSLGGLGGVVACLPICRSTDPKIAYCCRGAAERTRLEGGPELLGWGSGERQSRAGDRGWAFSRLDPSADSDSWDPPSSCFVFFSFSAPFSSGREVTQTGGHRGLKQATDSRVTCSLPSAYCTVFHKK